MTTTCTEHNGDERLFCRMQDHGLRDALTGDHHFEQAGFIALMK